MSLRNLGNLSQIVDVIKDAGDNFSDYAALGDITSVISDLKGDIDPTDAIKGFQKLGIEGEELGDILGKMGYSSENIKTALSVLGSTGTKSASSIGSAFKGLGATIKSFVLSPLGKVTIAIAAVAAVVKLIDWIVVTDAELAAKIDEKGNAMLSLALDVDTLLEYFDRL